MTTEELLKLRCFAVGSTTAVILAMEKIILIINKSKEIRIRF